MAWKERVWAEGGEGKAVDLNNIELGIRESRLQGFLAPEPTGTDDTAALQTWLNEAAGNKAVFRQGGGHPYKVKSPIDVPLESWVTSLNPASTEIERIGNGDLFRCAGASVFENLYVRAERESDECRRAASG